MSDTSYNAMGPSYDDPKAVYPTQQAGFSHQYPQYQPTSNPNGDTVVLVKSEPAAVVIENAMTYSYMMEERVRMG